MADKKAVRGVVVMTAGDTYTPVGSQSVQSIVVYKPAGTATFQLSDDAAVSNVLFNYIYDVTPDATHYFGIHGALVLSGVITASGDATAYIYLR